MFKDSFDAVGNAGLGKYKLLSNNFIGYLVASIIAGVFISFGTILAFTVGSQFSAAGSCATKIVQGLLFSIALSLVISAGSELFTGNNLVMTVAGLQKKVSWGGIGKLWIVCYIGNIIGSLIGAVLYQMTGIPGGPEGPIGSYYANLSVGKMSASAVSLLSKGILCNILVCIAVWCSIKMTSEIGKLVICLWCVTAFVTCGFEHSIANMSFMALGLMNVSDQAISVGGYVYNLVFVTLGNMIGGILVALGYYAYSYSKESK